MGKGVWRWWEDNLKGVEEPISIRVPRSNFEDLLKMQRKREARLEDIQIRITEKTIGTKLINQ